MPSSHKILLISLARNSAPPSHWYLRAIVRGLSFLGYKLSALGASLATTGGAHACLTIDRPDSKMLSTLSTQLRPLGLPLTAFIAAADTGKAGLPTWDELGELQQQGLEIGTIGDRNVNMTECSAAEQRQQVGRANTALQRHLGARPRLFAYPFGAYDASTLSLVKNEGFVGAVTQRQGLNDDFEVADPFHLRRVSLSGVLIRDLWRLMRSAGVRQAPLLGRQASRLKKMRGSAPRPA